MYTYKYIQINAYTNKCVLVRVQISSNHVKCMKEPYYTREYVV